jgi:hypothetical protein
MELAKMNQLLEAYFEGNTTLEEEARLKQYFTSEEVAAEHMPYAPIFASQVVAREEKFSGVIEIPSEKSKYNFWNLSIAASIVVVLGVSSLLFFQNDGLTSEQKEALAAYNQAKETMYLLSENLNKGASKVTFIDEFAEGTAAINLINQFTESKNKFLK